MRDRTDKVTPGGVRGQRAPAWRSAGCGVRGGELRRGRGPSEPEGTGPCVKPGRSAPKSHGRHEAATAHTQAHECHRLSWGNPPRTSRCDGVSLLTRDHSFSGLPTPGWGGGHGWSRSPYTVAVPCRILTGFLVPPSLDGPKHRRTGHGPARPTSVRSATAVSAAITTRSDPPRSGRPGEARREGRSPGARPCGDGW